MGKANHLKPTHTGGTICITTRHKPARELATHPDLKMAAGLEKRWPRTWSQLAAHPYFSVAASIWLRNQGRSMGVVPRYRPGQDRAAGSGHLNCHRGPGNWTDVPAD